MLEIRDLEASYGDVRVLRGLSLTVEAGSVVALLGPNAAGKSTLLRTISGLLRPRAGTITLEGQNLVGVKPNAIAERGIAHVPEGRRVFPSLSVQDNLLVGGISRRARPRRAEKLDYAYELFPVLHERRRQSARTLSGGEQQMLAIARGLMLDPKLIMLDEPSLGLAPRMVETVFEHIGRVAAAGLTVLLVEQNAMAALGIAHAGFFLHGGKVVQSGTSAELRSGTVIADAYMRTGALGTESASSV